MQIGVVSIQRDRAPWLLEWIAFHLLVGVSRVHLYLHACQDGSEALVQALARHYPIAAHVLSADVNPTLERPQSWFDTYDCNECDSGWRWRFLSALKRQVVQMRDVAGLPPDLTL